MPAERCKPQRQTRAPCLSPLTRRGERPESPRGRCAARDRGETRATAASRGPRRVVTRPLFPSAIRRLSLSAFLGSLSPHSSSPSSARRSAACAPGRRVVAPPSGCCCPPRHCSADLVADRDPIGRAELEAAVRLVDRLLLEAEHRLRVVLSGARDLGGSIADADRRARARRRREGRARAEGGGGNQGDGHYRAAVRRTTTRAEGKVGRRERVERRARVRRVIARRGTRRRRARAGDGPRAARRRHRRVSFVGVGTADARGGVVGRLRTHARARSAGGMGVVVAAGRGRRRGAYGTARSAGVDVLPPSPTFLSRGEILIFSSVPNDHAFDECRLERLCLPTPEGWLYLARGVM